MSKKLCPLFGLLIIVVLAVSNIAAVNVVDTTSRPPKPPAYCEVVRDSVKDVDSQTCQMKDLVQPQEMKQLVFCYDYYWSSWLHRWVKYVDEAYWTDWEPTDPEVITANAPTCNPSVIRASCLSWEYENADLSWVEGDYQYPAVKPEAKYVEARDENGEFIDDNKDGKPDLVPCLYMEFRTGRPAYVELLRVVLADGTPLHQYWLTDMMGDAEQKKAPLWVP